MDLWSLLPALDLGDASVEASGVDNAALSELAADLGIEDDPAAAVVLLPALEAPPTLPRPAAAGKYGGERHRGKDHCQHMRDARAELLAVKELGAEKEQNKPLQHANSMWNYCPQYLCSVREVCVEAMCYEAL